MISMCFYSDSKFTNVNYPRKENALHEVLTYDAGAQKSPREPSVDRSRVVPLRCPLSFNKCKTTANN